MRILLTTLNARFSHSSLALRCLRSYCSRDFPQISLKEFTINDRIDRVVAEIYRNNPEVIGFSCYIWNISQILMICSKIKKICPRTLIVLGGPEVSYASLDLLKAHPFLDYVVVGEGEETFCQLLFQFADFFSSHQQSRPGPGILGLAYRDFEDNQVKLNPLRPQITELEHLPFPYRDLEQTLPELAHRIVYYESSRGCPFACSYCLSSAQQGVRFLSISRVKRELSALVAAGIKQIKFVDRTFNFPPQRAQEIMQFIIDAFGSPIQQGSEVKTRFHFEIGASLLDEKTLEIIRSAPIGLFEFEIGVQSIYPPTLAAVNRPESWFLIAPKLRQIAAVDTCHLHIDLIVGLPQESYQIFRESFNAVFALRPNLMQIGFLKLLKGTKLREEAASFGCIFSDQPPYEVLATNVLDFSEVLRLSTLEDLVELYYNTHRFSGSLEFLILFICAGKYEGQTPFDFFDFFGDFWLSNDYHLYNHNQTRLFEILWEFAGGLPEFKEFAELFGELLRFDFLLQSRGVRPPQWLNSDRVNPPQKNHSFWSSLENIQKYLPHLKDLSVRKINKQIYLDTFTYDVAEIYQILNENQERSEDKRIYLQNRTYFGNFFASLHQETQVIFDYSKLQGFASKASFLKIDQKRP